MSLPLPDSAATASLLPVWMLPLWMLHLVLLYLSWKRWGLAVDADILVIRKGVIGVDHLFLQAFKIQNIARKRTPLMRRHHLSAIHFTVASSSITIPHLRHAKLTLEELFAEQA